MGNLMKNNLRIVTLVLAALAFTACATPETMRAVQPDATSWLGANLGVLYHYLGTPDSVEASNGRVGFNYTTIVPRGAKSELQSATFWVVDGQVVEVTGEVFGGPADKCTLVLWGRSSRRLSAPQHFDRLAWDRRLGLSPSE